MNYEALTTELLDDPENLGYASLLAAGSDNAVASLMNEKRFSVPGNVGIADALIWIAKYGLMARLRAASASANAQVASIAEVSLLLVQNPNISSIDLGLPQVQTMLATLVLAGVLTQAEVDEFYALGATQRSRAQVLGFGVVSADDISRAMEASRWQALN